MAKGSWEDPMLDAPCTQLERWERNSSLEPCARAAAPTRSLQGAQPGRDGAQQPEEQRGSARPLLTRPVGATDPRVGLPSPAGLPSLNEQRWHCHVRELAPERDITGRLATAEKLFPLR